MRKIMEKENKNKATAYYSLRFDRKDSIHKAGERVMASTDTLRIGQQEDCGVRLENKSDYADELFAVIRPCKETDDWQLVTCSPYVKMRVNGVEVSLIHYLTDGDRISFDGITQELLFNVHTDGRYDNTTGIVTVDAPLSCKLVAALLIPILILIGISMVYTYKVNHAEKENMAKLEKVKSSVMQINVDSVLYSCSLLIVQLIDI